MSAGLLKDVAVAWLHKTDSTRKPTITISKCISGRFNEKTKFFCKGNLGTVWYQVLILINGNGRHSSTVSLLHWSQ